ncbi:Hypothetical predicted protein, partial [Paramuricea clavata]
QCSQNWYAVLTVLEQSLLELKRRIIVIATVYLRSDNAGCYHCAPLLLSLPSLGKRVGVNISRYDFSEAQSGKDLCDRKIAPMKSHLHRYINQGHDVVSAQQMWEGLNSGGGVRGCYAALFNKDMMHGSQLRRLLQDFHYGAVCRSISFAYACEAVLADSTNRCSPRRRNDSIRSSLDEIYIPRKLSSSPFSGERYETSCKLLEGRHDLVLQVYLTHVSRCKFTGIWCKENIEKHNSILLSLLRQRRHKNTNCIFPDLLSAVNSMLNSGAETNILPMSIYQQLKHESHKLGKPTMKLTAYGGAELPNLGSCFVFVKVPDIQKLWKIQVQVVDVNGPMIIGNKSAQNLGLLKLNWAIYVGNHDNSFNRHISNTSATTSNQPSISAKQLNSTTSPLDDNPPDVRGKRPFPLTKEYLLEEYSDVFTGVGCFPGDPYHIEMIPDAVPVQHAPRQVPIQLQTPYKDELDKLVESGILSEVQNEYTPWVNSTVVTQKPNGTIRLCLDPRDLNKVIKRNPYYVRTIDDVIPKVSGATHFSILDARCGYWQVELDEESSRLCTFNTPWGKYRWNRVPFGLTCSGDIFQEKMDATFGKLDGLSGIADDTFIYGKNEAEHDQRIIDVLETARKNNVRFNPDKFQFKVEEASFFGLTWTPGGIKPDEHKIKSIRDMPSPSNLTELQSFLGMMTKKDRLLLRMSKTNGSNSEGYNDAKQRQQIKNSFSCVKMFRNPRKKTWTPGKVIQESNKPRSYVVETPNGGEVRRNRIHLKPGRDAVELRRNSNAEAWSHIILNGRDAKSNNCDQKLKTDMGVKVVVLRHDDHDQEMKALFSIQQTDLTSIELSWNVII